MDRCFLSQFVFALAAAAALWLGTGCDSRSVDRETGSAHRAFLVKTFEAERRSLARTLTNAPGVWGVQEYPPGYVVFFSPRPRSPDLSRKLAGKPVWDNPADVAADERVDRRMKAIFARLSAAQPRPGAAASLPPRTLAGPDALDAGHVMRPPDIRPQFYASSFPEYRTSEFFLGTIAVALLLPESNGNAEASTEDWTDAEVTLVQEQIAEGLLYAQAGCRSCRIGVVVHTLSFPANGGVTGTVDTDYEAIAHDFNDIQVNHNILSTINPAYATGFTVEGFRMLANDLREQLETDWAVVVKVGRDVNAGGRNWGVSSHFAVSYLGGPFMALTFKNGSWDENSLWSTFAHELNHSFYALDEYETAGISPAAMAGYYQVANAGSAFNDGNGPISGAGEGSPECMMTYGLGGPLYRYCAHTQGQIGWWDDDGDGLPNPFDAPPVTQLTALNCASGEIGATGAAWVNQNALYVDKPRAIGGVSGLGIIDTVEYRINRLTWLEAAPTDGAWDEGHEGFSVTHALPDGDYALDVRARDSFGNETLYTARALCTVAASAVTDAAPFARFDAPALGKANSPLSLDAGASSDLEDPAYALSFRWDWEGDGFYDTAWASQPRVTHVYPSAGTYQVRLAVRDLAGNVSEATRRVEIVSANQPPHLRLEVDETFKGGTAGPVFSVSVSQSTDLEGEALQVRYDFENDGIWNTPWLSQLVTDVTYVVPEGKSGAWTLAVELKDASGGVSVGYANLRAVAYNHPPVAQFTVTSLGNAQFQFDATGTYDPDGATTWDGFLEYRWDFDGDGAYDTHYSTNPVAQYTYRGPGTYAPTLEARDRFRLRDVVKQELVLAGAKPSSLLADFAGSPYAPRLSWSAVSGAPGYVVQIATDPGFQQVYSAFRSKANSADAPVLSPATNYYWRVSALTPYHEEIGYSGVASFKTISGPPDARALVILPEVAVTDDELLASYEFVSGGLPEAGSTLRWYRDDVEVSELRGKGIVPPSMTTKGEAWRFTVEPRDGLSTGETRNSDTVTIQNTPPAIRSASIVMVEEGTYQCVPAGWRDADGDPESYRIHWWHDEKEIADQETLVVDGGQWLICEIRPFDGEAEGIAVKSDPVGLRTAPPRDRSSGGCSSAYDRHMPVELFLGAMGWAIRRKYMTRRV
jgi:PKD repeat protein